MFAKSVIALAAVASFAVAAPVEPRGAPAGWAYGYLEDYDTYHVRYLALKCQNKHNTDYFQSCCRPMLSTENLYDNRAAECRPSQEATDAVKASLAAKAAGASATPASSAAAPAASSSDEDCDDDTSSAAPSSAAATTAAATTSAAKQAAPSASSTTTAAAAPTTSSAGNNYVAPAPSSSTTTTKAYTPPATTQAPAPTTQAPAPQNNNAQNNGGYATYFYQGGNPGACGQYHGDYDMIAAIDKDQWGSSGYGGGSSTCGRWLTVCNNNNNKCVSVMIADVCPTCTNSASLDLSVGAFKAIANESDGMVPIRWSWN